MMDFEDEHPPMDINGRCSIATFAGGQTALTVRYNMRNTSAIGNNNGYDVIFNLVEK